VLLTLGPHHRSGRPVENVASPCGGKPTVRFATSAGIADAGDRGPDVWRSVQETTGWRVRWSSVLVPSNQFAASWSFPGRFQAAPALGVPVSRGWASGLCPLRRTLGVDHTIADYAVGIYRQLM
jgi:hypothetical protein